MTLRHDKPQVTATQEMHKEKKKVFSFCFFPVNLEMGFTSERIIYHDQWGCLRVTGESQGKQGQPKGEGTNSHTDSTQLHPNSWPLHQHYVARTMPPGWLRLVSATQLGIRSTLNGENQKEWRGYDVMCDHTGTHRRIPYGSTQLPRGLFAPVSRR